MIKIQLLPKEISICFLIPVAVGVEFEFDETKSKSIPKFERGQPFFSFEAPVILELELGRYSVNQYLLYFLWIMVSK